MTHHHQVLPEAVMQKEPVVAGAAVLTLVSTVLGLLVAFGVTLTPEQVDAVLKFATAFMAIAPLVVAFIVRRKTVTVAKNEAEVAAARAELPPGAVRYSGGTSGALAVNVTDGKNIVFQPQNPQDGR